MPRGKSTPLMKKSRRVSCVFIKPVAAMVVRLTNNFGKHS